LQLITRGPGTEPSAVPGPGQFSTEATGSRADLLRATLDEVYPVGFRATGERAEEDGVITAWIAFETRAGRGSGLLRLVDGKAFTLLTTLEEPTRSSPRCRSVSCPRSRLRFITPSGSVQEGLWFHGGNLALSRYYSLYLALQLKARMEGIPTPVCKRAEVHHTD